MRKLFAAILAVILAVSAFLPAECAEVSPDLSSVDYIGEKIAVSAKQGETVEIAAVIKKAKLLNGLLVKMCYDSAVLEYEDTQRTNLGRTLVNTGEQDTVAWSIMFSANGTNIDSDTEVITLKFKAKSDISADSECFSYSVEEFYDTSYSELPHSDLDVFCRVNGQRVEKQTASLYGDANNDGKVTNADALAIVRHAIKASVLPADRLARCDVNGDGKVTNADALQITRYCIGYKSKYPIGKSF